MAVLAGNVPLATHAWTERGRFSLYWADKRMLLSSARVRAEARNPGITCCKSPLEGGTRSAGADCLCHRDQLGIPTKHSTKRVNGMGLEQSFCNFTHKRYAFKC